MTFRILVEWVVEQWCHGHPVPEGTAVVADVIVPRAWVDELVAEAEEFCRKAATATV